MALHSDLPVHRTGVQLLTLAVKAQAQMPRGVKRHLGDKLSHHCMEMLDRMALANATQQHERSGHIEALLRHQRAATVLLRVGAFLPERLHVQLNPSKTILQPLARGIDFVGHVIKPWHRTTRRKTLRTALSRLERMPAAEVWQSGNSYLGLLGQASHGHQDRARLANALRKRGLCVKADLSKAYRRHQS